MDHLAFILGLCIQTELINISCQMNKQTAFNYFEAYRKELLEYARWIAIKLAKENNGYCTIDLVREQIKEVPKFKTLTVDPRVFGAVFRKDIWGKTGYTQTKRQNAHGRPIAIFKLKTDYRFKRHENGNYMLF